MTGIGLVPERSATIESPMSDPQDYRLLDERGELLGVIVAPRTAPVIGRNAPTIYLVSAECRVQSEIRCEERQSRSASLSPGEAPASTLPRRVRNKMDRD